MIKFLVVGKIVLGIIVSQEKNNIIKIRNLTPPKKVKKRSVFRFECKYIIFNDSKVIFLYRLIVLIYAIFVTNGEATLKQLSISLNKPDNNNLISF